jgi:hypothetical protein
MTQTTFSPPSSEGFLARWGQIVLVLIIVAAIVMFALSFQAWIDFGISDMSGMDADAATGFSDGGVTAMLSSAIAMAALGILVRPRWTLALLPAIGLAAAIVFSISVYDILIDWHVGGIDEVAIFVLSGDPTAALYAVAALSALIALLAALLAAVRAGWVTHSKWLPATF